VKMEELKEARFEDAEIVVHGSVGACAPESRRFYQPCDWLVFHATACLAAYPTCGRASDAWLA
jgi:hypothetical protein